MKDQTKELAGPGLGIYSRHSDRYLLGQKGERGPRGRLVHLSQPVSQSVRAGGGMLNCLEEGVGVKKDLCE